jgi:Zn-dependent protease with chaperone function
LDSEEETGIEGRWFPPASSRRFPARLRRAPDGGLTVLSADGTPVASASAGEAGVVFPGGGLFETPDNDGVDQLVTTRPGRLFKAVHRLERFHPRLFVVLIAVIGLGFALYRFALPVMVEVAVLATPPVVPALMSRAALESLDSTVFRPTELGPERRAPIEAGFEALAALGQRGASGYTLLFRDGRAIGPNAFALPDGTVVLTDALVGMAGDNTDMVLGVLAHEIGHVDREHSLRQLYRLAGITGLILMIGGDIGGGAEDLLIQGSALLSLSYSRSSETEADRYSVEMMAAAGRDPAALAAFFERLQELHGAPSETDFLSTHPATPGRIREIRRLAEAMARR